jgi:N-acetylglucosamine kinase-like BadF-type ATPase
MHFLGIDAGATGTQWALINQGGLVCSGSAAAMDGHIYRPASKKRMEEVLLEISNQVKSFGVTGAFMGITGVTSDGSIEILAEKILGVPIRVVSDIELAYRANFPKDRGILLYAGTGSVAFTIDDQLVPHQIGGWGYLLGDEGAGYWIGREAIRHALSEIESKIQPIPGSLAYGILDVIGGNNWDSVKTFVYSQERSAIASLANQVETFAKGGEVNALKILTRSAAELAYLVKRMDNSLENILLPVIFTGGISKSTIVFKEIEKIIPGRVAVSNIDIATRAAQLAI